MKICSIESCEKLVHGHGWCHMHYNRWWKYGDPLKTLTAANGEPERYLREVLLTYEGNDCLAWPYALRHGYGLLWLNGRTQIVSRLVCERVNGPPPTPEYEAAHSCGKGHLACCTKRHLSWKTSAQNKADKLIHGTHQRGERCNFAKLTEPEARQILALKGKMLQREIGELLSVSRETVSAIHRRKNWAWVEAAQ